jgi:ABC-type nitrate/sulfonate/bicarbonate transport system substrate-binding protein
VNNLSRRSILAAITVGAAAALGGCAEAPSSSGGKGASFTTSPDLAAPGSSIPEVTVKAAFPPWGDELLGVAGVDPGYYKAVGITIVPAPYGAQQDLLSDLTPLVNGQVELGGGYIPTMAKQIDTVKNVVGFAVSDVSYVYRIVAPTGKYRTVKQEMAAGKAFTEALTTVMAQLKGKKLICVEGGSPLFRNAVAEAAGLDLEKDVEIELLANPDLVRAGFAGKADFLSPSSAGYVVQLQQKGWEPLIDLRQVIDNLPTATTVPLRFTYSGLVTTTEYAEANFETLLRFTSVLYRLIDDLQTDAQATAARFVDYLNEYTGTEITAAELAGTFDAIYSLRNFDEATGFYTERDDPFFYDTVARANLAVLAEQGVIAKGHTPDELSIAGKIYAALLRYRKEADRALAAAPGGDLKSQAQAQYDARNYLDAYRLAAAATQ